MCVCDSPIYAEVETAGTNNVCGWMSGVDSSEHVVVVFAPPSPRPQRPPSFLLVMHRLVPVALFGAGLAVGVGSASILVPRRREKAVVQPTSSSPQASVSRSARTLDVAPAAPIGTPDSVREILALSGNPGPIFDQLAHDAFVSCYDRRLRHPAWTAEHLTAANLQRPPAVPGAPAGGGVDRSNSVFKEDERIPLLFRARLADYFRSGYDRGHQVPAADAKRSQLAMNETFLLTNMAPQVGAGFNRDYWAHTEDFVRRLTARFADVYVFTIPLYLPRQDSDGKWRVTYEVIGNPPNVAVPTHFAKVILATGKPSLPTPTTSAAAPQPASSLSLTTFPLALDPKSVTAIGAFVEPNAIIPNAAPLRSFQVPVETVERAAGLTLFSPATKAAALDLCDCVPCQLVIRDFSKPALPPGGTGKPERRNSA